MATKAKAPPLVHEPGAAAARLGLTVEGLVELIRLHNYEYFERKPGGKPGDRGRGRWGMTDAQIEAVLRGQARVLPRLQDEAGPDPGPPAPSPVSPDGRSRLRRGRARR